MAGPGRPKQDPIEELKLCEVSHARFHLGATFKGVPYMTLDKEAHKAKGLESMWMLKGYSLLVEMNGVRHVVPQSIIHSFELIEPKSE